MKYLGWILVIGSVITFDFDGISLVTAICLVSTMLCGTTLISVERLKRKQQIKDNNIND